MQTVHRGLILPPRAGQVYRAAGNPVLPIGGADPTLRQFGDRYYLYATGAGATEAGFTCWSSADLRDWRYDGVVLRLRDTAWAKQDAWAPDCIERNGKFYFYFSADSRIGVAVGDKPTGPFRDRLGRPLVPYKDDISVIDPQAFLDDDGQAYLYYGAVPASWLRGKVEKINTALSVQKLGRDMITLTGPEVPTVEADGDRHIEGSWVIKRRKTYYLFYSQGNWDALDERNGYRVMVATAPTPLGPWTKAANNPILATDTRIGIGATGHNSILHRGGDDYLICYHAHSGDRDRRVYLDRLHFEPDGTVRRVTPTREGVGAKRASRRPAR